ncbi:LOW QUALITY PROTEIN: hypothetical protein OSB04_017229 [Centaurea solstitialis]|uniref:Uncharacterized protein n=1 Tax=Centaurea solstitialis TaxID=347529 RepID=A0AA38T2I7_9ASTR|nr:LOW QUALITY PROTEIN: hypothetical protein OSB04_017229 [Centaurea solstitialis]
MCSLVCQLLHIITNKRISLIKQQCYYQFNSFKGAKGRWVEELPSVLWANRTTPRTVTPLL